MGTGKSMFDSTAKMRHAGELPAGSRWCRLEEPFPVRIILKNLLSPIPVTDHMIHRPRILHPLFPCHAQATKLSLYCPEH